MFPISAFYVILYELATCPRDMATSCYVHLSDVVVSRIWNSLPLYMSLQHHLYRLSKKRLKPLLFGHSFPF